MKLREWFLLPARAWMAVLFAAPFAIVLAYSLMTRGDIGGIAPPWTAESYARLIDPLYLTILWRSFVMAAVATALCLLFAFPAALFISRSTSHRNLYLQLVMLPFWTSFLVRTYAWLFLLRDTGLINTLLESLGLTHAPLPLLYNDGAVLLGLVYGYLPFMVLPIYATLERLDPALVEAAADLGARPMTTVFRVIVPLSKPGIVAGSILVFIPCLGAYLTPDLLGGGRTVMVGNLVQNQFTTARDWPFGSAISMALMLIVTLLLVLFLRKESESLV
ncbi:MAG: binding-protein-dependent transport system inner rane component [Candidatus Solibacter sp.]|nr:binding-protein-dependent transport system inner rane component [Candidatus Solibacter sp.]